jgi:hypothetical protein
MNTIQSQQTIVPDMKKRLPAIIFLAMLLFRANAQDIPKEFVSLGLSGGKSGNLNFGSMPVTFSHRVAPGHHDFRYQVGLRQNLGFGAADFTFNDKPAYIDDLSNYSLNLFAGLEYISPYKFLVGFNIDLIGGTFGTRSFKTLGSDPVYSVHPEELNLFKGGTSDQGSLNNELYLGYRFNENITLKAGLSRYLISINYSNPQGSGTAHSYIHIPFAKLEYVLWQQ